MFINTQLLFSKIIYRFTKYALMTALAVGALAYSVIAQVADEYVSKLPAMDFYSAPNIVQGNEKGQLEYYGSGDVNNDGVVNFADAQAVYMGTRNDMADVDGNGTVDSNDGKIIENYASGKIDYLPSGSPYGWQKLSPLEKEAWADKMIVENIKEPIEGYLCGNHATRTLFNFTGIENAENWTGIDHFYGTPLDFSKYAEHVDVGNKNIPLYMASLRLDNGEDHFWVKILLGDRKGNEETNPLNRDHWKIYNYYDGTEVTEEGPYLDENGPLGASTKYWDENKQKYIAKGLLEFDLNNGKASIDPGQVNRNILLQNPHQAIVDLKKMGDVYIEAHEKEHDTSEESIGKPTLETNLKEHTVGLNYRYSLGPSVDYTPKITSTDEKKVFDEKYPEYFEITRKYNAATDNMGRWNSSNLENLSDSTSFKITVDDRTAPEVTAPEDVTAGYNADMSVERMGKATATDASPYALEKWIEDVELSNDGVYKVIERTHFAEDVRGNVGSDTQRITLDLNTGIEELNAAKSFDLDQNYPNPVTSTTTVPYASTGGDLDFKLVDITGFVKMVFEKDNTFMGEGTFQLNMSGMAPGQYILFGNDEKGSVDRIKINHF